MQKLLSQYECHTHQQNQPMKIQIVITNPVTVRTNENSAVTLPFPSHSRVPTANEKETPFKYQCHIPQQNRPMKNQNTLPTPVTVRANENSVVTLRFLSHSTRVPTTNEKEVSFPLMSDITYISICL